jgi:hypothetical protein
MQHQHDANCATANIFLTLIYLNNGSCADDSVHAREHQVQAPLYEQVHAPTAPSPDLQLRKQGLMYSATNCGACNSTPQTMVLREEGEKTRTSKLSRTHRRYCAPARNSAAAGSLAWGSYGCASTAPQ